jgi:hypothetical protein
MGVEPPFNTSYKDIGNGQFETVIDTNYSNPDQWADPSGYASIENSKGTTVLDRNFVQVYPGVMPAANVSNIGVVPNPYIVQSGYKESEHLRQIRFTNLPSHCRIRIFTISGECVAGCNDNNPFEHQSEFTGNAWWDMRSENNQEIAPGLYLFHVEQLSSDGKKVLGEHIGKFAVIR